MLLNPGGPDAVSAAPRLNTVSNSYLARSGVGPAVPGVRGPSAAVATRLEGVPVEAVFGAAAGFRRPGLSVTVEPGAVFARGRGSVFASVPIRVDHPVKVSLGFVHDSTFGDQILLLGTAVRLGG